MWYVLLLGALLGVETPGLEEGNHVRVAIYDLGHGDFLAEEIPLGIVWSTESSPSVVQGRSQRWIQYLQTEDLSEEVLRSQHLIWTKIGPPPPYLKSIVVGGDPDEGLTLLENYLNHRHFVDLDLEG